MISYFILQTTFSTLAHLTRLDLSKNALNELPDDFGLLVNLLRLDLFSNKLKKIPVSCVHLKRLKWLDLKENPIQTLLPDIVGNCLSAEECKQCADNVSLNDSYSMHHVYYRDVNHLP